MLRSVIKTGLFLVLLAGVATAQQAASHDTKVIHHHRHAKHHHAHQASVAAQTRVDVYNGSNTQTQIFNDEPVSQSKGNARPNAKPGPAVTRVDVINGSVKQMQVFNAEPAPGSAKAKTSGSHAQRNVAEANLSDVEIFNGTTKQRKVFRQEDSAAGGAAAQARKNGAPVVVGVATSGSETKEKTAPKVVTGIDSGPGVSKEGSNAPVAVGVSPAPPKRPTYVPGPQ